MKLGIAKKLIGTYVIGLVILLLFIVFSYVNINSFVSMQERSSELSSRIELSGELQTLIQKLLMPANDYLITGDKKERENFAHLVTETAAILEKIKSGRSADKETRDNEEAVEKGLIELQQKAMVLLTTGDPIGNKEAAALMEDMDKYGDELGLIADNFHLAIRQEMEIHSERASEIKRNSYLIFIFLIFVSLAGIISMAFRVRKNIAKPLSELTDRVKLIGQGNLDIRIKIETDDELEWLGTEFNNMAQSLGEKVKEVREYSVNLEKTNTQLDQNILQLFTLYNVSKAAASTFEVDKLFNQVVEKVNQGLSLHRINVMLVDDNKKDMSIVAGIGMPEKAMDIRVRLGEGVYGRVALTGQAEIVNDVANQSRFTLTEGLDDDISSIICSPFKGKDRVLGLLNAYRLEGGVFTEADLELLAAVSSQVGMALENARLFQEVKTLAITDGMTSLYNHRYFRERFKVELERANRYKRPISLIMIDIDFFKHYNDAHGHPQGDEVLKSFSVILKKTIRDSDIACRYGGEEFAIILPETGGELAFAAAERVRKAIETNDFPGGETQPCGRVTVSMGVSSYTEGMSADELLKSADNALYRAKEEGRNRVCKVSA